MAGTRLPQWIFSHWDDVLGWVNDGEYDAPRSDKPFRDGREANISFQRGAKGAQIAQREQVRSTRIPSTFSWWHRTTGASMRIFDYVNWAIRTGVGIRMDTHSNISLMGFFLRVEREWDLFGIPGEQHFGTTAQFHSFDCDATGVGW